MQMNDTGTIEAAGHERSAVQHRTQLIGNAEIPTEYNAFSPAPQSKQFRSQFPSPSQRIVKTPNRLTSCNSLFFNETRPAPFFV